MLVIGRLLSGWCSVLGARARYALLRALCRLIISWASLDTTGACCTNKPSVGHYFMCLQYLCVPSESSPIAEVIAAAVCYWVHLDFRLRACICLLDASLRARPEDLLNLKLDRPFYFPDAI